MSKRESKFSILTRILTNYIQVLTLCSTYSLNYPSYFLDSITPMGLIGEPAESILSIDCFIEDNGGILSRVPSKQFVKAAVSFFLPPLMVLLLCFFWGIIYVSRKIKRDQVKKNLTLSVVVVLFLIYPSMISISFGLFNC